MDEDKIELLERRLAESVTKRVRPALFRVYATIGAAVIATILSYFPRRDPQAETISFETLNTRKQTCS